MKNIIVKIIVAVTIISLTCYLLNNKLMVEEPYIESPPVYWPLDYKYGQSNVDNIQSVDTNVNTLFTAHPIKLVCSKIHNKLQKHARLNHSGGIMYISYQAPTEEPSCKQTECPYTILKSKILGPTTKCWECIDNSMK